MECQMAPACEESGSYRTAGEPKRLASLPAYESGWEVECQRQPRCRVPSGVAKCSGRGTCIEKYGGTHRDSANLVLRFLSLPDPDRSAAHTAGDDPEFDAECSDDLSSVRRRKASWLCGAHKAGNCLAGGSPPNLFSARHFETKSLLSPVLRTAVQSLRWASISSYRHRSGWRQ